MQEAMERMAKAVEADRVETVTMQVGRGRAAGSGVGEEGVGRAGVGRWWGGGEPGVRCRGAKGRQGRALLWRLAAGGRGCVQRLGLAAACGRERDARAAWASLAPPQVATQRRSVLEAVAFGTFLRDVETWVQDEFQLLTPTPPPMLPPGMAGAA
jgi:hypothetical protein